MGEVAEYRYNKVLWAERNEREDFVASRREIPDRRGPRICEHARQKTAG